MTYKPSSIIEVARRNGITHWTHEPWQRKIRFERRVAGHHEIIDVWYSTMTVGTTIDHPTKGRNTLFRKRVTLGLLNIIFQRPRLHTHKGYYRRDGLAPWH